jgi:hypothetical protein
MTKIGDVARMFGISTQTIRLYEVEGLLISYKSDAGTRWYSESDIEWIRALQGLLDDGLNFAGIRRLLAQIPCWELKPCRLSDSAVCPARLDARLPCWLSPARLCAEKLHECHGCTVYRRAGAFTNLKASAEIHPHAEKPRPAPGGFKSLSH